MATLRCSVEGTTAWKARATAKRTKLDIRGPSPGG